MNPSIFFPVSDSSSARLTSLEPYVEIVTTYLLVYPLLVTSTHCTMRPRTRVVLLHLTTRYLAKKSSLSKNTTRVLPYNDTPSSRTHEVVMMTTQLKGFWKVCSKLVIEDDMRCCSTLLRLLILLFVKPSNNRSSEAFVFSRNVCV